MATTATQLPAAPAPAGTAVAASTTAAAAQRPRPPRKITAHRKSRTGCRNCKLRKVRCDETRPKCIKCDTYGILCNYDPRHEDLQWSTGTKGSCSGVVIDLSILDLCRNLSSESGCLASSNGGNGSNTSDDNSNSSHHSNTDTSISQCQYAYKEPEYQPLPEDRETLKRFFSRTVYTLAPRHCVAIYRDIYSKLCESVSTHWVFSNLDQEPDPDAHNVRQAGRPTDIGFLPEPLPDAHHPRSDTSPRHHHQTILLAVRHRGHNPTLVPRRLAA